MPLEDKFLQMIIRVEERVNGLKERVDQNRAEIHKLHGRINDLIENELKHYRGMSKKEKGVLIGVPSLIALISLIITLIQAIG